MHGATQIPAVEIVGKPASSMKHVPSGQLSPHHGGELFILKERFKAVVKTTIQTFEVAGANAPTMRGLICFTSGECD